ncbi:MAG: tetratricopeptide repeat protein [Candidatus Manganitrophus sp.]|nr:tetratricopeptide repeat protein [Candidatus Manganitrophus sp.]
MAELASQIGEAARAEALFKEAVAIDPASHQPRLFLAKLYEQLGKTDEAIREYDALLLINHDQTIPEIRSAKESLFSLLDRKEIQELTRRGDALAKEGKWGEALQLFQTAAAIDPGLPIVHHNLARFYDQTNRPDLLLQSVKEALLLEPDSRTLHLLLGKALRAERAFKNSLAAYVKTLSLSPKDQQGLFYLEAQAGLLQTEFEMLKAPIEAGQPFREGLQRKANGELDEAQALLEQAARLSPESPLIYHALGEIYEKKGEREKGIAAFEKGVELHPGLYPTWRVLSRLYTQQGRYTKALDALERLLSLSGPSLTSLGTSREELQKEIGAAQQKLEEARARTRSLFNQAQEALAKGEKENAISLLETAYNQEKDNSSILYSLGIAYAIEGKWSEATDVFKKILDSDPLHLGALLRLGAVQEASGVLPTAAQTYRRLLLQKERSGTPEYKEATARLAAVTDSLKRLREAERHEKRGLAILNKLSEAASKNGTAAGERPDPAQIRLALWNLKQAVALRPEEVRYHYNLGLLYEHINFGEGGLNRENAKRVKKEPRLLEEPVAAYRSAITIDPRYLPPYARLGYLYEWQEENDIALAAYKSLLAEAPEPRPMEVKEIESRVQTLERRFFGNVGYFAGVDSNFTLSDPPQDETFNSLSANLVYYLVRHPGLHIPLSYQTESTFYYRFQTYFSNHSLSLGFQHQPAPSLSYGLTGRYQASLAKNGGLALLLSQGTASLTYFREIPTVTSIEYGFSDLYFRRSSRLDAREHRGTVSFTQTLGLRDEADLSYTFIDRQTPNSQDNSYQGHRLQLGYRRWLLPNLQFRGSASVFLQNFLHPDTRADQIRENTLLSYSVGLLYPWTATTQLFVDYRWQENRSNLGPAILDELDILLGRSPALGDYEKRTLTLGVNVAF